MPISDVQVLPRQWDVVVLPFPYSDRLAEKRRPGVVVSKRRFAEQYGVAWAAMITSARNAGWDCDIVIEDLGAAGLVNPSVIRPLKLATVDIRRVIRVAGRIGRGEQSALRNALSGILA